MDHIDLIQVLRTLVADVLDTLKGFPRKAEEQVRGPWQRAAPMRIASMLRYCPERDFDQITAKLALISQKLNELEARVEDALDEKEEDEDDGRED